MRHTKKIQWSSITLSVVDEEQEEKRNEETKQKRVWNLLKLDEEREGKSKTSNDGCWLAQSLQATGRLLWTPVFFSHRFSH